MKMEINEEQEIFECPDCNSEVKKDDEFCTECGALFADEVKCSIHSGADAAGVCIICSLPFCSECGGVNNKHFLCNTHYDYEIYQGMARVYGTLDDPNIQFVNSCLKQAGLHPFVFCRIQPKGGTRIAYSLYESNGDYRGHIVNEIKIMVPCQEVEEAENVLRELKIIE
jgi:hypothetical protein